MWIEICMGYFAIITFFASLSHNLGLLIDKFAPKYPRKWNWISSIHNRKFLTVLILTRKEHEAVKTKLRALSFCVQAVQTVTRNLRRSCQRTSSGNSIVLHTSSTSLKSSMASTLTIVMWRDSFPIIFLHFVWMKPKPGFTSWTSSNSKIFWRIDVTSSNLISPKTLSRRMTMPEWTESSTNVNPSSGRQKFLRTSMTDRLASLRISLMMIILDC